MYVRLVIALATATHWYYCGLSHINDAKPALLLPIADVLALLRRDQLRDRLACFHFRTRERREVHSESVARTYVLVEAHSMCGRGVQTVEEFGRNELGRGEFSICCEDEANIHGDPTRR